MTLSVETSPDIQRPAVRACPTCRQIGAACHRIGPSVFSAWEESELSADLRAQSGDLYRCAACHLIFRWPIPTPEALRAAYDHTPISSWKYEPPAFWKWTAEAIARLAPNQRVLDVGCFRGDFLASLPAAYERFGIEPNAAAADAAAARGITIIGDVATADLSSHAGTFGTITLMDVIEHVPDPRETLERLRPLLAPGGIFVIITGNADYWLARMSLPFYYYTSFPSHLVFLGEKHLRGIARHMELNLRAFRTMTHERVSFAARTSQVGKMTAVMAWQRWLSRGMFRGLGSVWPLKKLAQMAAPPHYRGLPDHMWIVLQTPSKAA